MRRHLTFMALWLVGSLLVLRVVGYRLARRPEQVADDNVESKDAKSTRRALGRRAGGR